MFSLVLEREQGHGKSQIENHTRNQYTKQRKALSLVLAFILVISTLMTSTTLTNESVAYADATDVTSYIDFSGPVLSTTTNGPINEGNNRLFGRMCD